MPQVVIVSSLGPQGPVGPQGPSGSFDNISGSFLYTSSFNAFTASYNTGSFTGSFTGSANLASFTASNAFVTGNVTVLGTASINTLIVNQTQLSTGSNQLGDAANDTQTLYGTVVIPTGSLTVSGSSYFSGSVGIGTSSPQGKLDVSAGLPSQTAGDLVVDTTNNIVYIGKLDSVSNNTNLIFRDRLGNVKSKWANAGAGSVWFGSFNNGYGVGIQQNAVSTETTLPGSAMFHVNKGTLGGTVASFINGNVGIGTTTPSASLDVNGKLIVGTANKAIGPWPFYISDATNLGWKVADDVGTAKFELYVGNSGINQMRLLGGVSLIGYLQNLVLGTSAYTNAITINNSTGNVGINTSSPSASLQIKGTGTTSATTAFSIQNSNASASLTVLDNGYVGIGSTTPLRQLYVVGDIEVTNGIYGDATDHTFYTIASGSFDHRFYSRTSGGASLERFTIQGGADTANTFFQNTNVGIGTTAPGAKLEIRATGSNETTQRWLDNAGNLLGDFAEFGDAGVLRLGYVISSLSTNRPLLTLDGGGSNTTAAIYLRSKSGTTNVRIASDLPSYISGSNLALGFTSPTANAILHISGAAADNVFRVDTAATPYALFVSGSGNVGIGTTTTAANLEIKGSATALQLTTSDYVLGASGSRTIIGFGASTGNTYSRIQTTDAGGVSASDLVLQADSGNVGIGITAPVSKLQVAGGGATYGEAITWTGATDYGGTNRGYVGYDAAGATTAYIGNEFTGGDGVSARFQIRMGTSPKLTVMSGGNIGIGTTIPSASLHISGSSGSVLLEIDSNSTQNILYVSGSGNIGVGTSTPGFKLDVNGSISGTSLNSNFAVVSTRASKADFYGFTGPTLSYYNGVSVVPALTVNSTGNITINTTTDPGAKLAVRGAGSTSATTAFRVENANASASLIVLDNGNVGIGTTNPSYKLDVSGSIIARDSYPSVYVDHNGTILGGIRADATTKLELKTITTAPLSFQVNYSEKMRVTDSGNIGIGTINPSAKLHVSGTVYIQSGSLTADHVVGSIGTANPVLTLQYSTVPYAKHTVGAVWNYIISNPYGSTSLGGIELATQDITRMTVAKGGNIGIGITTPSASLHISGSSGSVLLEVDSNSSQNILYVSGSGAVGIGTSNPTYPLQVESSGFTQLLVKGNETIRAAEILILNSDSKGLNINVTGPTYASGTVNQIRLSPQGTGMQTVSIGASRGVGTTTFTANTFTGNVGINIDAPTARLHVSGAAATPLLRVSNPASVDFTIQSDSTLTDYTGLYWGTDYKFLSKQSATLFVNIANNINFSNGFVTRTTMNSSGQLGIGVTSAASILATAHVRGAGATSATTALRVENSNASSSLTITDDLTSRFFGNVGIGALPASGSLHISGAASTSSAAVYIYKSGSTTLDIQGSQGQLFSVTDALSGSLMSVNDISGLPILEVFSDDRVVMGSFSQPALLVTGSAVRFPATASTTPTYTGSEGQVVFGVVGGNAFIYAWLGGRWRSGSLA